MLGHAGGGIVGPRWSEREAHVGLRNMQKPLARLRFARDHRWSQRHMSEYIDAEMTAASIRRIERHTDACRECRALLASLQTMISALAGLSAPPAEPVAGDVAARVRQRLAADDDQLA